MLYKLTDQSVNVDLTGSGATVLSSYTPAAAFPTKAAILVEVGDGADNLDAGGGTLTLEVTVNGQRVLSDQAVTYTSAEVRTALHRQNLFIPANAAIEATLVSDNGADTGVAVTTTLYEESGEYVVPGEVDTATNGHTPTATEFDLLEVTDAADDYHVGRQVMFRTGSLAGQQRPIVDYTQVGGIGRITTLPFTAAPSDGDRAVIRL